MQNNLRPGGNMKEKKSELTDGSSRLVERLGLFWNVIRELTRSINDRVEGFSIYQESEKELALRLAARAAKIRIDSPLLPLMNVLPHLHFPEGTLLDYYQYGSSLGSEPELYVRKENERRLPNNSEPFSRDPNPNVLRVLDAVRPEFTPEGVWELLLLMEFGSQFNLVWHAAYGTARIICDMEEFFSGRYFGERNQCRFDVSRLSDDERSELLSWDVVPKVKLKDGKAIVNYCVFSPFFGFIKCRRTILFTPELRLQKPVKMKKIPYSCGITF